MTNPLSIFPCIYGRLFSLPGVTYYFFLFFSAQFTVLVLLVPIIPLVFFLPLFRTLMNFFQAAWVVLPIAALELFAGLKIVITGDEVGKSDKTLMISNHRTTTDWLFLWSYISKFGRAGNEKVVLKESVKNIFGLGWGMQLFNWLFLKRDWVSDQEAVKKHLKYWIESRYPIQLLIFPEGTNFSTHAKKSSDNFALENNLPTLEYTLQPRTTGFVSIFQQLREYVDCVVDITIGYPDVVPVTGADVIIAGNFSKEIHINIKKFSPKELPESDEELTDWLRGRWLEKERKLEEFYNGSRLFDGPILHGGLRMLSVKWFQFLLTVLGWVALISLFFKMLIYSPLFRLYCIVIYTLSIFLFLSVNFSRFELNVYYMFWRWWYMWGSQTKSKYE